MSASPLVSLKGRTGDRVYRHATIGFVLLMMAGLLSATSGCATPSKPSTADAARVSVEAVRTKYEKRSNFVYTPSQWPRALPSDLYLPEGVGPWPAVILIYGGSWDSKDHRWWMTLIARKLAKRGYVVMNVAYRGAPEFQYPAPLEDLREAVKTLRAHATEWRVNPQQLAAYGFSAGGHLASLLGTIPAPVEERIQAVVAVSAPSDLTLFRTGEILPRFLGATYAADPGRYVAASPTAYVSPDDPPFFLYHGTGDETVAPEHSRRLSAELERAGVRHELRWVEKRGHAAMLFRAGQAEDAAIDFLDTTFRAKQ